MKGKIGIFGLIIILGFLAIVLSSGASGWAQKAKVPKPSPPPTDPAIAYVVNTRNSGSLKVMNADGSNQRAVVSERYFNYACPDWSPDGTSLVFTRYDVKTRCVGIHIVNVNGTGLRKVADTREFWASIAWSPMPLADGLYKIAFTNYAQLPDGTYDNYVDIFLVNLDGTGLVRLTHTPGISETISWSPSADRITSAACCDPVTGEGGFVVWRVDHIGGIFSLTTLATCFDFGWGIWANTQDKLATGKNGDAWICDLFYPFQAYQLTSTPSNYEHDTSWSPDDSNILYVQGPSGQLYSINPDGSGQTAICPGVDFTWRFPRWRRNP